jgi:two-component system nitrate/nitrite response regulator NarP
MQDNVSLDVISILVADDHVLLADAVAHILGDEKDFRVTTAQNLSDTLAALGTARFDIVLLDVMMPGMEGLVSVVRVIAAADKARVVLFSGNVASAFAHKAIASGAAGFIPKTLPVRSLPAALRLVHSGQVFMPVGVSGDQTVVRRSADAPEGPNLTALQTQILRLVQQGKTNKEIARSIDTTEMAVKMHLRSIFAKLNARNRAHAVTIALASGLI